MRVTVVDYNSGNLQSVMQSLHAAAEKAGLDVSFKLSGDAEDIAAADRIVLPGVGSFADCAQNLRAIDGMEDALNDAVFKRAVPFLGICVGMQLMAERGFEDGETQGLGWISGHVEKIKAEGLKIPHMGWSGLDLKTDHAVFKDIEQGHAVYFVHSYHFNAVHEKDVLAEMHYGGRLIAAIGRDNMMGMQFHPEKSQNIGQVMLTNWLNWTF